jgi:hypothetical protein
VALDWEADHQLPFLCLKAGVYVGFTALKKQKFMISIKLVPVYGTLLC